MNIQAKIESILFFRNEPIPLAEISKALGISKEEAKTCLESLREEYRDRGIVVISNGEEYALGTHPDNSELVETMQKEELSRDLGKAGLETLAIILYRGPVSRREIDHIRGVNSGFILRTLLVRGLVERVDVAGERSYSYKPTLKLLEYLGVTRHEDLPEYGKLLHKIEDFVAASVSEEKENA